MCNTDIEPNRLAAAPDAAVTFVGDFPAGARVGLVIFNGLAALAVPSTDDTDQVVSAIESITVARGTAISSAMPRDRPATARRPRQAPPRERAAPISPTSSSC
jgi:Ca-activated chloride channel family protein